MGQAERALPRSLLTDVDQEALQLRLTAAQRDTAIVSAAVPLEMRAELERRAQKADRSLSSEIRATADRLRTAIGRGCKAAGVPLFSPHDLRHRRISLLHAQGRSWAEVARFVGQRSSSRSRPTRTRT